MRKNIQSIVPKLHAYLHSMQETSAKFQNNRWKSVRGVAPIRYPLSIHFHSISCKKETISSQSRKKVKKNKVYQNHRHIFIPWVVGLGDGAGELPVPGHPATSRTRACCACSRCGTGGLYFFIFFIYLPFLMSCVLGDRWHYWNIIVSAVKPQR